MYQPNLPATLAEIDKWKSAQGEKRTTKRVSFRTEIEWTGPDMPSIKTRTENLSTGGTFIKSITRFPVGSVLRLKFRAGQQEVQVTGEVCYCLPQKGIGIRFLDLSPEQQAAIESLIQERLK